MSRKKIPSIEVPPSKSHSMRALILASLSLKKSKIKNILLSGDTNTAIKILKNLGVKIILKEKNKIFTAIVEPPKKGLKYFLENRQLPNQKEIITFNVENSGSLLYFLGIIFCFFNITFILTGDETIQKRPIDPILEIYGVLNIQYEFLDENNLKINNAKNNEQIKKLPIKVFGKTVAPHNSVLPFFLSGKFSQVITGLLIASSLSESYIEFKLKQAGELPYLRMTTEWLKKAGIKFNGSKNFKHFKVNGKQNFKSLNCIIPADWSSAAFPIIATIMTNSSLKIKNIDLEDSQGDSQIVDVLKNMGVKISFNKFKQELTVLPSLQNLKGIDYDCSETPDLIPALSALACFAKGKTILKNIEICRFKECDRISVMKSELLKIGASVEEGKDFLLIDENGIRGLHSATVNSFGDHRIEMAFLCLNLALKRHKLGEIDIINSQCYSISYPTFLEHLGVLENQL